MYIYICNNYVSFIAFCYKNYYNSIFDDVQEKKKMTSPVWVILLHIIVKSQWIESIY